MPDKNSWRDEHTNNLCRAFLDLKDIEEVYKFLEDLATIGEIKSMAQRLEVAKSLDDFLKEKSDYDASKIALDNRRASSSLHEFLEHKGALSVIVAIGSERGWTERERDLLEKNGFTLCSMGSRVLRTETAATVASSIILDSMGFLN